MAVIFSLESAKPFGCQCGTSCPEIAPSDALYRDQAERKEEIPTDIF
ncbi:MAG TPA: hypothetical protein VN776_15680 [Terracidiphilus sp.]|nr:hypothetical protein [Terracidiphilus sp.]